MLNNTRQFWIFLGGVVVVAFMTTAIFYESGPAPYSRKLEFVITLGDGYVLHLPIRLGYIDHINNNITTNGLVVKSMSVLPPQP